MPSSELKLKDAEEGLESDFQETFQKSFPKKLDENKSEMQNQQEFQKELQDKQKNQNLCVGIISNTYYPEKNGESVAVQGLERELKKKGIKVYLAVPQIEGVTYPDNIFAIKSMPVAKSVSADLHLPYNYINDVCDFFTKKNVTIIHTHNTLMGGMEGAYIALKMDVPCVHTFHTDIQSYDYWNLVPGSKNACKALIKIILNNYDHIIALSSKMQKYLLLQGIKTPITRSHNIPLLGEIKKLNQPDEELAKKLGINIKKDIVVLTHGRVAKEKGIDVGIEIMSEVIKQNLNVKYLIAGVGVEDYVNEMKQKIDQLGIKNNVIFSGAFSAKDLGNLASLSKIYLNTSTTENHPTTVLEAMHLGLTGVFIDDLAFDYIVQDGYNAFMGKKEDLASYVNLLISDQKMYNTMSKAAVKSAEEYCSHDYAQDHIGLYNHVIEHHNSQKAKLEYQKEEYYKKFEEIITKPLDAIKKIITSKYS